MLVASGTVMAAETTTSKVTKQAVSTHNISITPDIIWLTAPDHHVR